MLEKITTAMILAAGRGERMRPLTDDLPKPLLMVGQEPLIVHHIRSLVKAGIKKIVINHAYLGHKIEAYLGNGEQYQVEILYSKEEQALETGGGIFNALPLLGDKPFWVVNGDVWTDYDFSQAHLIALQQAHLILMDNPEHHPQGDFVLDQGRVLSVGEQRLTYSGLAIFRASLFTGCSHGKFPLAPLLRSAIAQGQVSGEYFKGCWIDVGTPQRLEQVRRLVTPV